MRSGEARSLPPLPGAPRRAAPRRAVAAGAPRSGRRHAAADLARSVVLDYTVADSNEVAMTRRFYPELRVAFDISSPVPLAWAFPPGEDRSLIEKAEEYFAKLQESGELDQLLEHYYGHVSDFDYVGTRRYMQHIELRLPSYRAWFQEAATQTGEDWRLLAAIGGPTTGT